MMKQLISCFLLLAGISAKAQEVKTINFPNGDTYEGQVNAQGIPHGKGKGIFSNRHVLFEGDWKNGNPNGNGRFVEWKIMTGLNVDTIIRYQGEVANGKITGNGTYNKIGKWVYTGGFLEGRFNGKGKVVFTNGEIQDGEWENGKLKNGTSTVKLHLFRTTVSDDVRGYIDRYGYADVLGNRIAPKYVDAREFSEGLAAVAVDTYTGGGNGKQRYNRQWGFIDSIGLYVVKPQYSSADSFKDGKAKVTRNGRQFYIDKTGQEVK